MSKPNSAPDLCEFGNVRDNEAAYRRAMWEIEHGSREVGHTILKGLRDHIYRTRELKSMMWLMPHVQDALCKLDKAVESKRQQGSVTVRAVPPRK